MRLSILPLVLAGAGLVSQVTAEPIRVVVENPSNANIRFGHALANANVNGNDDNVARVVRPAIVMTTSTEVKSSGVGRHFCGAALREKALRMSNALRHALGLPLIESDKDHDSFDGKPGGVHILPVPYVGTSVQTKEVLPDGSVREYNNEPADGPGDHHRDHPHHHPHHRPHHGHKHHKHHKGSFANRVHRAVMALGPWEGRAVAFVLGCGIGVLLRMFWVLSVLAYRTIRGEREEVTDHAYIVLEQDAENLYVPPPQYTDEKVKAAEAEAPATETRT
ncbi:hypothetical protein F5I97DRAFT_1857699 [Phlebopus sp. FC_14]|nr:hypothetical protein F5I97DRAFT_1857699 [Phlebopus sp. FC_14]